MNSRVVCLWMVLGLVVVSPTASLAQDPPADPHAEALRRQLDQWKEQEAREQELRQQWQERERERIKAIETARSHLAEVEAKQARAKKRGAYEGVTHSEWTRRAEEAQKDVSEAERDLRKLHEEGRRADVPPGWFQSGD